MVVRYSVPSALMFVLLGLLSVAVDAGGFGGGSSPAGDDAKGGEKKAWKSKKSKLEPGVSRCDPFGDYGSFSGIDKWVAEPKKFDGKIKTISGKKVALKSFAGKALLVANVAANSEGAAAQIQALNDIAASYPKTLEVLGFWSKEFADKDVGSVEEFRKQMKAKLPADFKLKFMIADNTVTNGPRRHSCYRWLKDQCSAEDIPSDFTKFLTTRQGRVHRRYEPSVDAAVVKSHIDAIINRDEI